MGEAAPPDAGAVELPEKNRETELAPGEIGMIEVRGPNVFQGYWRMPEQTAAELRPDGWFITGDLGTKGTDGYVSIVGRAKDLVISGGLNVYPREVEMLVDDLPGVLESAVIGVPHPDFGALPMHNVAPRLTSTPGRVRTLGPTLGQHNDEVWRGLLGVGDDELAALRQAGAV